MVKGRRPATTENETVPPVFPDVKPQQSIDMPAYTTQMIFEMSGTLGRIEEKLAGLDKRIETVRSELRDDFNGIDTRFRSIEKYWHWIAGGVAVAVILVPFCGGIVWYSLQDKIEAIIQLVAKTPTPATPPAPTVAPSASPSP